MDKCVVQMYWTKIKPILLLTTFGGGTVECSGDTRMVDDEENTDDLGDKVEETLELIFIGSVEIFGFTSSVLGLEFDSGSHNSLILPIPQDVVILETSLQPIFPGSSPADIAFILSSSSSYLMDHNIKSGYSYL